MPLLSLPRLILLGMGPMKTRSCIMSEILWNPRELTPNILSQGQKIGTWALPGQMVLLLLLGTRRTRNQPQKESMLGMLSTFMDLPLTMSVCEISADWLLQQKSGVHKSIG